MNSLGANMKLIVECSQKLVRLGENLWGKEQKLDKEMQEHSKLCDETMAIQGIEPIETEMEEDDIFDDTVPLPDSFVERMVHKIADSELFKADPLDIPTMTTDFVKEHGLPCPEGYIFKDENGNVINATKIVLEKKKKEYPKTYEECCKVLNIAVRDLDILDNMLDTTEIIYSKNLDRLLNSFRKLLICRDAYWKIAGEEMGLDKPWEPDWTNEEWPDMAYISYDGKSIDKENGFPSCNIILSFPTEEMRDAFYENFKSEIESCKELL